jgi:UDP-N-acetylglucosamine 4,6-dehydratase
MLNDKVILVTGGTGSFGRKFVEIVLSRYKPRKLIIFSRDELKQLEMRERFDGRQFDCIRYFIGDVRDRDRLYRGFDGVDIVVHAAALKQVPTAEYNPIEAVKTNVLGAANVIDAAIDRNVRKVIALSTDKAASPVNLYGATKLCADKLFSAANSYSGYHATRFSVVRYGNVIGSRGSVIPLFLRMRKNGVLPITDPRMTRFWLTLEQGVDFVLDSLQRMRGGEVFVPKIPSMRILDLAEAIAPECKVEITGIRPGEKLHEFMITADDAHHTLEYDNFYVILPAFRAEELHQYIGNNGGKRCPDGFRYSSDNNSWWLTREEMKRIVENIHGKKADIGHGA